MRWTNIVVAFAALLAAMPALSLGQEETRVANPVQVVPAQSTAEKPSPGEKQSVNADGKPGADERQPASRATQVIYPQVESVMEGGVQVVRRTRATSVPVVSVPGDEAAPSQEAAAVGGQRAAVVKPYRLARVRIADNWKYAKRARTAETQRTQLWEYRERRHRTYQPKPQRGADEVDRLTRYRRTQD